MVERTLESHKHQVKYFITYILVKSFMNNLHVIFNAASINQ